MQVFSSSVELSWRLSRKELTSLHVQGTPWSDNESSEDERNPKRKRQESPSANDGRSGLFSYDDE